MYLISPAYVFYGMRMDSAHKNVDCLNFATIFRQQIKCDTNIMQLISVRVVRVSCTTRTCFIE
jgi:hypothetical protein